MPPCGFAFRVSPNPSNDVVKIEVGAEEVAKSGNAVTIKEVELYN
jgi:hypothetical protein